MITKLFQNFKKKRNIRKICNKYHIRNFKINKDFSVDVNGDVNLIDRHLDKIPIKFNKVSRKFFCSRNNLTTLENSPRFIRSEFYCGQNQLTTFLGGPLSVGTGYFCSYNNLRDVYGFPEAFKGSLLISGNPINEIIELVTISFKIKFIYWLNEYNVIRNQNAIVEDRLQEALYELKLGNLRKRSFEHYKLI